jgi:hypothetical protein
MIARSSVLLRILSYRSVSECDPSSLVYLLTRLNLSLRFEGVAGLNRDRLRILIDLLALNFNQPPQIHSRQSWCFTESRYQGRNSFNKFNLSLIGR